MEQKNLEYYLNLPYKIEVLRDYDPENPGWVATIPDLPGCITQVDSFEELENMIEDAKQTWLEAAIERGIPIPEPRAEEEYSGKFVVRVPRSLHRKLVEEAESEGVSLNQFINVALASEVRTHPKPYLDQKSVDQWSGLNKTIRKILLLSGLDTNTENLEQMLFCEKVERILLKISQNVDDQNYYAAFKNFDELIASLTNWPDQQPIIDLLTTILGSWRNDLKKLTTKIRISPPQDLIIKSELRAIVDSAQKPNIERNKEELTLYGIEDDEIMQNLFVLVNKQGSSNE